MIFIVGLALAAISPARGRGIFKIYVSEGISKYTDLPVALIKWYRFKFLSFCNELRIVKIKIICNRNHFAKNLSALHGSTAGE